MSALSLFLCANLILAGQSASSLKSGVKICTEGQRHGESEKTEISDQVSSQAEFDEMKRRRKYLILTFLCLVLLAVYGLFDGLPIYSAPYSLTGEPIVAMRIVGNEMDSRTFVGDPNMFYGYSIVQRRKIDDQPLQQQIVESLGSRFTYGGLGAMCFEPGIAIRFGESRNAVDVLICLDCGYAYFYQHGSEERLTLSATGKSRLKSLYGRLFPGHDADVEDDEIKKIKDERAKEWNVRIALKSASSQPATAP